MTTPAQVQPEGTVSDRTTFSALTAQAGQELSLAAEEIRPGVEPVHPCLGAHAELTAALAHLGTTILAAPRSRQETHRSSGRDVSLARALEQRATAWDWEQPRPTTGAARRLHRAAILTRAAADLWATHHSPDGAPRSPEASLMRHPAMLGAATRQWHGLVSETARLALLLEEVGRDAGLVEGDLVTVLAFPTPGTGTRQDAPVVDLTVANPAPRRGTPLHELDDRIARLHRISWSLAKSGLAPIPALAAMAEIAELVARHAATVHQSLAQGAGEADTRDASRALHDVQAVATDWGRIRAELGQLCTAHSNRTTLQLDRLEIARLLDHASSPPDAQALRAAQETLDRALARLPELARHHARAVQLAHERGEILIRGRALPGEVVSRRPELLEVKLRDGAVPAPTASVARLLRLYRAASKAARPGTPDGMGRRAAG